MVCTIRNYRKILLRFTVIEYRVAMQASCNIAATKTFIAENLHISWGKNVMHWYTKPTILLYILTKKYIYIPILLLYKNLVKLKSMEICIITQSCRIHSHRRIEKDKRMYASSMYVFMKYYFYTKRKDNGFDLQQIFVLFLKTLCTYLYIRNCVCIA